MMNVHLWRSGGGRLQPFNFKHEVIADGVNHQRREQKHDAAHNYRDQGDGYQRAQSGRDESKNFSHGF